MFYKHLVHALSHTNHLYFVKTELMRFKDVLQTIEICRSTKYRSSKINGSVVGKLMRNT